ncbi:M43 family zinc metalloprotease [Adhaeribacter soli]|nr:M43 family zinc metalloprotease [Adhaeribacter soli]
MTKTFWLLFATIFTLQLTCFGQGQPDRGCATNQANALLLKQNPAYRKQLLLVEKEVQAYLKSRATHRSKQQSDTIPVVFHVVYNSALQNVSDAQLLSQLTVLNEDFNRRNADTTNTPPPFKPVAGSPQLYFCLASLDPHGKPTAGITRTFTPKTSFKYTENEVKFTSRGGRDAWNTELYLNIWICNLADNILGYAQFPGGPPETDGIVLKHTSVGRTPLNPFPAPYNRGRTATHEIGHWLGLRHIWGDADSSCTDSDFINDTPNQFVSSSGCPSFPKISCNNGPNGDMFMNFMDYTNDACMNLFTKDQSARMNAVLQTSRRSILNSNVCTNVLNADFRALPDAILPGETTDFFYYSNGRRPTKFFWIFEGGTPATSNDSTPQNIRYDQPGAYTVTLTVSDSRGTDTEVKRGYIKVTTLDLQLFPNPANREISVGAPAGQTLRRVEIFSSIGQLMREVTLNERATTVNTSGLQSGLYIIRGRTAENKFLTRRLVIQH